MTRPGRLKHLVFGAMTMMALAGPSEAVVINAFDRGWYSDNGFHQDGNNNTLTGQDGTNDRERFNSFFTFNLSGVTGTVTSGTLRLELAAYLSPDAAESFTVFDVGTAVSALNADHFFDAVAIYGDLQSGNVYGTGVGTAALVDTVLEITLSAQAIADINAAGGGSFAVGVHADNIGLAAGSGQEWLLWSIGDEGRIHQLDLTTTDVPVPATLALLPLGLAAAGFSKKRK